MVTMTTLASATPKRARRISPAPPDSRIAAPTNGEIACASRLGDRLTGQLLGVQMVGAPETSVAKRIDTASAALFAKESVEDINALDLSYSPPLNSPWDPLQSSAQDWLKLLPKIN